MIDYIKFDLTPTRMVVWGTTHRTSAEFYTNIRLELEEIQH